VRHGQGQEQGRQECWIGGTGVGVGTELSGLHSDFAASTFLKHLDRAPVAAEMQA